MPVHDWTRVDAGIFHDFHQRWIVTISSALNRGLLPGSYYAMAEQHGGKYEPDVLTLKARTPDPSAYGGNGGGFDDQTSQGEAATSGILVAEPKARVRVETDLEYYRRKQNVVAVRHVSGDELVAVIEIVSKANKSGRAAFDLFVKKATQYLGYGIHLLILDLQPPTSRDPQGIHGAIWDAIAGEEYVAPSDKPLTLAAYESGSGLRAFVEPIAVGDVLSPMPLFLWPGGHVPVPLEETYQAAWESFPRRWREVVARP